jgi:HAD superfamily hydrolase (TIGR01459 family)
MTQIIGALADVSDRYDAVFCDLWGCLHNGQRAYPAAVAALQAFRAKGGTVLLLTNAPRPRADVAAQIDGMGVPRDCWDVIATSGDAARAAMFRGLIGQKLWHIGEAKDTTFFDPLNLVADPVAVERVELDAAEGIICTGPFDPHADPAVMRPQFLLAKQRGLKMICANPDIVVDRGDTREWCAGALAKLYVEMGGEAFYFGKPQPQIYDLSRQRLEQLGKLVPDGRILAIGDGILTDISGAVGEDIDSLFVTGGLAAAETKTREQPDPAALEAFVAGAMMSPTYALGFLR